MPGRSRRDGTPAMQRLLATGASSWSIFIRLSVGLVVFLPEGIQKSMFPGILGAGRFANIGLLLRAIMVLGLLYLRIEGAGAWSMDAMLASRARAAR